MRQIAVDERHHTRVDARKQVPLSHHAAAEHDAAWRDRVQNVDNRRSKVERLQILDRIVRIQLLCRFAGTSGQSRSARHSFEATTVKRANAGEVVARDSRHHEMPHLRMDKSVKRRAVNVHASAYAGTYREVDDRIDAARRTPAMLCQRGGVHVRIKADRHAKSFSKCADDIEMLPTCFGRGSDITVRR